MTATRFVRVLEPHKKRPRRKNRSKEEKDQATAAATKKQPIVTYPTPESPESTPSIGNKSPQVQTQSQIADSRLRPYISPRLGRDSHLDADKIDPFGALPVRLTSREQELLPFFSVACNFSVLPADLTKPELSFAYQWVIQAVHHPLLLTITCLHASVFQDLVFKGQALSPMSMKFLSNTLSNVQQALAKETVPSAEVMSAVTTLVSISLITGDISHIGVHVAALERIVSLRGGFEAIDEYDGLIRMSINWVLPLAQIIAHLSSPTFTPSSPTDCPISTSTTHLTTTSSTTTRRTPSSADPLPLLHSSFTEISRICTWLSAAETDPDLKLSLLLTFSNVCGAFERNLLKTWRSLSPSPSPPSTTTTTTPTNTAFPLYDLHHTLCMTLALMSLNRLRKLPMQFLSCRMLVEQLISALLALTERIGRNVEEVLSREAMEAVLWVAITVLHPVPDHPRIHEVITWVDGVDCALKRHHVEMRKKQHSSSSRYYLDAWPWDSSLNSSPLLAYRTHRSMLTLSDCWKTVRVGRITDLSETPPGTSYQSNLDQDLAIR